MRKTWRPTYRWWRGRRRNEPRLRAGAALIALALAAATRPAAAQEDPTSCVSSLETRETLDRGLMLEFRCDCRCTGAGIPILVALLRDEYGDRGPPPEIEQLFVGRLEQHLPEVAEALSLAAVGAADWDGRRGWASAGYANGFVRDLTNAQHATLYGDLDAAFARWGISIEVVSVEKVLMAVPADLAYGDRLVAAGADPRERVPFDGVVWFRLMRAAE